MSAVTQSLTAWKDAHILADRENKVTDKDGTDKKKKKAEASFRGKC